MSVRSSHLPADVLGLSELARGTLAGRPHPPILGGLGGVCVPGEVAAVPEPPEHLEEGERHALARALEEALARHEPHVAVLEGVRALRETGATLVLAGQQPGLCGGPLYDLYKALHVVRLARSLAAAWGRPVVPAFWNHADDHDVAEVHHLWILNANLDLQKAGLGELSSGRRPLSELVFDADRHRLGALEALLRQELGDDARTAEALELFLPREGESFAAAFTRVFLALLGAEGLVVLEPDWIREPLTRSLARVAGADPRAALEEGTRAVAERGQEPPIDPRTAALFYHHGPEGRRALRADADGFRYDGEEGSRTPAELAAELVQEPAAWSAGALLRPLVQDLTLPVAAYVGGWGELAYHAQLPAARRALGIPATPFVPRLSATLVDPPARSSLEKLGLGVEDVLARGDELEAEVERGEEEPPVVAELEALRARTREEIEGLGPDVAALDPGLANQVRRSARDVDKLLDKLAGKARRAHANARGRPRRHLRRLSNGLLPRGAPQERIRGTLEFAARFGTDWIGELLEEIDPFPTEHLVVHLEAAPQEGPRERNGEQG